jgi:hypothetical protein
MISAVSENGSSRNEHNKQKEPLSIGKQKIRIGNGKKQNKQQTNKRVAYGCLRSVNKHGTYEVLGKDGTEQKKTVTLCKKPSHYLIHTRPPLPRMQKADPKRVISDSCPCPWSWSCADEKI